MFACLYATGPIAGPSGEGREPAPPDTAAAAVLLEAAREFSPRVEPAGTRAVVCDISGTGRLFGDPHTIASELRREAADRGLAARVAIAATRTAALLAAHGRPGLTVIDPGAEAAAMAALPVAVLDTLLDVATERLDVRPAAAPRFYRTSPMQQIARERATAARRAARARMTTAAREAVDRHERMRDVLERWGIRTLGQLAALPAPDVAARLGPDGAAWQHLARGEDDGPLVPWLPDERFESRLDLEWPIEGLEPLSFVLGRLLEPLCARLERRDRAAAALVVDLRLVSRETFTRRLQLPVPLRDMRVLRTLALLDLDAHPPPAGIDAVTVRVEPTPGRVLQYSLLERARPAPEQVSTLLARLTALMGEGRCGAPEVPDTFRPGAFTMRPFVVAAPGQPAPRSTPGPPSGSAVRADDHAVIPEPAGTAPDAAPAAARPPAAHEAPVGRGGARYVLRRFRHPIAIRVALAGDRPARVTCAQPGVAAGRVEACAGPWHTSGEWWADGWDRHEWDVALEGGAICRIFQDRTTGGWFADAVVD